MRRKAGVLVVFFLISTALLTGAVAQPHPGGGGGGGGGFHPGGGFAAPHIAAPSPHFSAPQVSAPRFTAPRLSAPSAHFAAPSVTAPHFVRAPRFTAPHITSRQFTAPHTAARSATNNGFAGRHVTTGATRSGGEVANNERELTNGRQLTLSTPQTKHLQMHYTGGSPILRNTTLANLSSRNPEMRSLARSTFRGNFAESNWGHDRNRRHHHHHIFGFVLGFVGPVFWPYAYYDCIDYLFSPYAYDTFWPYAYDDAFEGVYGAYAPEYYATEDVYAYAGAPASSGVYSSATGISRRSAALPGGSQICSGQAQGLTDFPIERIAQQVNLDQHQQALLDDLKAATAKAVNVLQAACPNGLPSTPTGRLTAMRGRVETMQKAVQVVRPALDAFYNSLSDEQKEQFNALDEDINSAGKQVDVAGLCSNSAAPAKGLPVARIEQSLHLSVRQDTALKDLNDSSAQAANILKGSCQQAQTLTPTGRLAAMEDRLTSMLQALDTVQPALARFYDSLGDEQKARFDRLNVRPA
jgi:hypothetical protein